MNGPTLVLFGLLIGVGTWLFLVSAIVIGGGWAAVRRQRLALGLLALLLVAMALAGPLLFQVSGGSIEIVALAVSAVLIVAQLIRRRRDTPELKERRAIALRSPRVRVLLGAWVLFGVAIGVLAAVLGRLSS